MYNSCSPACTSQSQFWGSLLRLYILATGFYFEDNFVLIALGLESFCFWHCICLSHLHNSSICCEACATSQVFSDHLNRGYIAIQFSQYIIAFGFFPGLLLK